MNHPTAKSGVLPGNMFRNLYQKLGQRRSQWDNEEEVRQGWIQALSNALGIDFHAERGRKDSSYNNVVIEFKDLGLFKGRINSPAFKEAIFDRLEPYILKTAKQEGLDPSDYIGIAIDGDHIAFAQVVGGKIEHGQLLPFSETSVAMVATACKDAFRRAISGGNLIDDFGPDSNCGIALMQAFANALSEALSNSGTNKIRMLFEEWRALYGQVADLSSDQIKTIKDNLKFTLKVNSSLNISASLFVIHTYNSLLIKLLAAEIISTHGLTSYKGFSERTATLDDNELLQTIRADIEMAGLFSRAGIKGFVEEAIFSWYIDACLDSKHRSAIVAALREALIKLSLYRTDKLNNARSNDVLKAFYQNLVPETLRKSLGEFYTPDWLVEFAMDKAEPTDWLKRRVLDPTCGSASFLLEALRRKRTAAEASKWSTEKILDHLTTSVWGFDLNPLAVQTSRVNFLIAIADLLKEHPGKEIELPILLADAIYSPAKNPDGKEEIVEYRIGSSVADLAITLPSELAFDRLRLDQVFEIMGTCVEKNLEYQSASKGLVAQNCLSKEEASKWQIPLQTTYQKVLNLHRQNWNGIWFRIVRNFFWSATAGKFDIIIGNPPWVRWSKLPDLYRERVKPTCMQYNIFSSTPHHGGNELDISGMITYTVADKWLKNEGTLIFVITQTHFQSPSSEGFRNFVINDKASLIPQSVDDMKALKPFPDAANKTAVAVFKKEAGKPKYPVNYNIWKAAPGFTRNQPLNLSKADILKRIVSFKMEATPVSGGGSPWAILKPGRFEILQRLNMGTSSVQGRKGITTDLNGVYLLPIKSVNKLNGRIQVETRPEAGDTDIGPKQTFWIEPDLLYPLIKGAADFSACYLNPKDKLFVLIPNKGITKSYLASGANLVSKLKKTENFFATFEKQLRNRSTFKGRMKNAPYFSIYNVGEYSFSPWKVIWAEQSGADNFSAAVAGSENVPLVGARPYVPDHKIFFVEFDQAQPAYFLCGLLNAPMVKEFVESHNIGIQMGDVFKHMALPKYSPANGEHSKLAKYVLDAHQEADDSKRGKYLEKITQLAETILEKHLAGFNSKKFEFEVIPAEKAKPFINHLPYYSLKAAAGKFSNSQDVEAVGWVKVEGHKLDEKMFIAQVTGKSMEPKISDGSYCVFRANPAGTRQGKIVLAQYRGPSDPDTGGQYTVKRYASTKKHNPDGTWEHEEIRLEPLNPDFQPIIIQPKDAADVQVIAEFISAMT